MRLRSLPRLGLQRQTTGRRLRILTQRYVLNRSSSGHLGNVTHVQSDRQTHREIFFDIVPTYRYTCALTGYRVTTVGGGTIVAAAHIDEFSDS